MRMRKGIFMKKRVVSMFLVVMMFLTMMPVSMFATEMSDEFEVILNSEGKVVVTDNSSVDERTLLEEFLRKYTKNTAENNLSFNVVAYNEDTNIAQIALYNWSYAEGASTLLEEQEVEVVFVESYSENFRRYVPNDTIVVATTSSKDIVNYIWRHVNAFTPEGSDFRFQTARINEDCTSCTVQMVNKQGIVVEQHVVNLTYITEMSEAYKERLNLSEDGKLIMRCMEPQTMEDFYSAFLYLYERNDEERNSVEYISEDFSKVDVIINNGRPNQERHTLEVEYVYDDSDNAKVDAFMETFPDDKTQFGVHDMELVNYWYNNAGTEDFNTLDNYSGELKSCLKYNNIKLFVKNEAGGDDPYFTHRMGFAFFIYEDVVYHVIDMLSTYAEHVIYVPSDTPNNAEAMVAAAQERIDDYLGEGKIRLSNVSSLYDAWILQQYEENREYWEEEDPDMTLEEFVALGNAYIPAYENFEDVIYVDGVNENDIACDLEVVSKNRTFHVIIKRDSSKMLTPEYKTVDVGNNVEISSSSSEIPLDTIVKSEELKHGTLYDKIISLLAVKDNLTYDLSLFSDSLMSYVSKLKEGTFEVKIPLSEELARKNLVAYYVDSNNKVVEYEVTVKDGYAIFETNHFSIYTIAEGTINSEEEKVEIVAPKDNVAGAKLEEDTTTVMEKVPFTEKEKALIEAGAEVVITLKAKDISETVSKEDKEKVENKVKEIKDQKIGMYLDINLFKQVGDNEEVKVPELKGKIKIQLTVPDELLIKDADKTREYSIIRIHDGEVSVIEAKFDADTKTLAFETDGFSTYALAYRDVVKAPDTGDSTSIAVWGMLLLFGGCVLTYAKKRIV